MDRTDQMGQTVDLSKLSREQRIRLYAKRAAAGLDLFTGAETEHPRRSGPMADPRPMFVVRRCLKCGKQFRSYNWSSGACQYGFNHRLCSKCNEENSTISYQPRRWLGYGEDNPE